MPRKKKDPIAEQYPVNQTIPVAYEKPKHHRRVKVLAKMLLKEVKGAKEKIPQGNSITPTTTELVNSPQKNYGMATVATAEEKIKKPRKPPTEKMLDWRRTFAEVRKKYPGRRTPEFDEALRRASVHFKQTWANRK